MVGVAPPAGYDLAAAVSAAGSVMGVTVNLPTAPADNGNGGTVTNMSQLTDATNTNGGVFEVQAGSYSGNITLDGLDQRFRFAEGFQLAAGSGTVITVASTARRIHLEGLGAQPSGAEFLGGMYWLGGPQDIYFKNLRIETYNNSVNADTVELFDAVRAVWERVDIESYRYCCWNQGLTDFVVANSRLTGLASSNSQTPYRGPGGLRNIVMDSMTSHPTHYGVRVQKNGSTLADYIYLARNRNDNGGNGYMCNDSYNPGTNPQANRVWCVNNVFYAGGLGNWNDVANSIQNPVTSGNTFPGGGSGPAWSFQ